MKTDSPFCEILHKSTLGKPTWVVAFRSACALAAAGFAGTRLL
jgi:hypothetical protein